METTEAHKEEAAQADTGEEEQDDEDTPAMDLDAVLSAVEAENTPPVEATDSEIESSRDNTARSDIITTSKHVTESKEDTEKLDTQADLLESRGAEPAFPEGDSDKDRQESTEDVKFFVTEQEEKPTGTTRAEDGGTTSPDHKSQDDKSQDNKTQADEDARSTTSSKKSLTKRVSFKIPPVEDRTLSGEEAVDDDDDDLRRGIGAGHNEASDSEDAEHSPERKEPLKVIVTHIEKSLGAPVSKGSDGDGEVIVKDP